MRRALIAPFAVYTGVKRVTEIVLMQPKTRECDWMRIGKTQNNFMIGV